jgi:hypothetical protein
MKFLFFIGRRVHFCENAVLLMYTTITVKAKGEIVDSAESWIPLFPPWNCALSIHTAQEQHIDSSIISLNEIHREKVDIERYHLIETDSIVLFRARLFDTKTQDSGLVVVPL